MNKKHWQDTAIRFERQPTSEYPDARVVIVHMYGATVEKCIEAAREKFKLSHEWEVKNVEAGK